MIIWAVSSVYPTRSRRTHALPYMYLMYLREAEVSLQCPSYSSALAADLGYGVVAHATDLPLQQLSIGALYTQSQRHTTVHVGKQSLGC